MKKWVGTGMVVSVLAFAGCGSSSNDGGVGGVATPLTAGEKAQLKDVSGSMNRAMDASNGLKPKSGRDGNDRLRLDALDSASTQPKSDEAKEKMLREMQGACKAEMVEPGMPESLRT